MQNTDLWDYAEFILGHFDNNIKCVNKSAEDKDNESLVRTKLLPRRCPNVLDTDTCGQTVSLMSSG